MAHNENSERPVHNDTWRAATLDYIRSFFGEVFYAPIAAGTVGLGLGVYTSFSEGTPLISTALLCCGIGVVLGFLWMIKSWFF